MFKLVETSDRFVPNTQDRSPLGAVRKAETAPQNKIALFGFRNLDTTGDVHNLAGPVEKKACEECQNSHPRAKRHHKLAVIGRSDHRSPGHQNRK